MSSIQPSDSASQVPYREYVTYSDHEPLILRGGGLRLQKFKSLLSFSKFTRTVVSSVTPSGQLSTTVTQPVNTKYVHHNLGHGRLQCISYIATLTEHGSYTSLKQLDSKKIKSKFCTKLASKKPHLYYQCNGCQFADEETKVLSHLTANMARHASTDPRRLPYRNVVACKLHGSVDIYTCADIHPQQITIAYFQ
jgi:hypothetical protein